MKQNNWSQTVQIECYGKKVSAEFWDKQVAEKQTAAIQINGNFSIEIAQILPISSAAVLLKFS